MRVAQGPRCPAAKEPLIPPHHQSAEIQALRHPWLEIAGAVELFVQPAGAPGPYVALELVVRAPGLQRLGRRFGGEHAGLDGAMTAFDAGGIEKAGVVADQHAARAGELGQGLQAPRGNRARAVRNPLSILEKSPDRRVRLEALEFLIRRKVGILVAEADDIADRDLVVLHVVHEGAAIRVRVERPACGMHDESGLVLLRLDVPELLETDAVLLGVGAFSQPVFLFELAPELAAAALGKESVFAVQLHARLVGAGFLALLADAEISRRHSND